MGDLLLRARGGDAVKQHHKKQHGDVIGERRAEGFRAGADEAVRAIGPGLMRRFFVRGMAAGAVITGFAGSLLWWLMR